MIKSNLAVMLAERKMKMSDLSKATGINRGTIQRLYHDEAARIELDVMDKLCGFFECTPGDIFTYTPD
ncbi:MAG: helix-turn-helix transcriptional regulator [Idiomarina sp.]|nr:helix-turn-helix transcriptional regulator [Idiomarina sp.]